MLGSTSFVWHPAISSLERTLCVGGGGNRLESLQTLGGAQDLYPALGWRHFHQWHLHAEPNVAQHLPHAIQKCNVFHCAHQPRHSTIVVFLCFLMICNADGVAPYQQKGDTQPVLERLCETQAMLTSLIPPPLNESLGNQPSDCGQKRLKGVSASSHLHTVYLKQI